MTIQEVKEISKLLPRFVQMVENDLGEDKHKVKNPLTYADFERVQLLVTKLKTCVDFVDGNIFHV